MKSPGLICILAVFLFRTATGASHPLAPLDTSSPRDTFAFPSQTLYLTRDTGLNAQKTKAVEAEVNEWRERESLPFPDLDPAHMESLKDSLDWPPAGAKGTGSADRDRSSAARSNPAH